MVLLVSFNRQTISMDNNKLFRWNNNLMKNFYKYEYTTVIIEIPTTSNNLYILQNIVNMLVILFIPFLIFIVIYIKKTNQIKKRNQQRTHSTKRSNKRIKLKVNYHTIDTTPRRRMDFLRLKNFRSIISKNSFFSKVSPTLNTIESSQENDGQQAEKLKIQQKLYELQSHNLNEKPLKTVFSKELASSIQKKSYGNIPFPNKMINNKKDPTSSPSITSIIV